MQYGCIGEKLSHSFSKTIHNEIANYDYELKEISKDRLEEFILEKDFKAINVTIPYKQSVIPFMDSISKTALEIGAVNTIVNRNNKLYGYNTDFSGMKALINYNGIQISGKKVLILGSGGTSKTAFCVAKSLNASEVYRVSRTGKDESITYDNALKFHHDTSVIINTTPCGMYPNIGNSAIDLGQFEQLSAVVDAVYNPLRSALVVEALKLGKLAIGGLYMLVAQAVFAAEKFTGNLIDDSEIERIYNKILLTKQNIVLIGMPGCGKSTLGKLVAKELGKDFYDTDEEIVKSSSKSIPQLFSEYGEDGFRKIESDLIKKLSVNQNCVIATGGGAVLNSLNIDLLKENGKVMFIDRPLELLEITDNRPLSKTKELLQKRYAERYNIYCESANIIIPASGDINDNVNRIKTEFLG